jgi:hypothetical protein
MSIWNLRTIEGSLVGCDLNVSYVIVLRRCGIMNIASHQPGYAYGQTLSGDNNSKQDYQPNVSILGDEGTVGASSILISALDFLYPKERAITSCSRGYEPRIAYLLNTKHPTLSRAHLILSYRLP